MVQYIVIVNINMVDILNKNMNETVEDLEDKNDIEDEAYTVIEATNEDGTIDGEIVSTPTREGDEVVFDVLPLTPTHESREIRMDWPKRASNNYKIVKICKNKVGGFQSIAELEGEKVKVDIKENDEFNIVVGEKNNKEKNRRLSIVYGVCYISAIVSLIGAITPFALVLALPWDIQILSFWQGVSLLIGSVAVLIASAACVEFLDNI